MSSGLGACGSSSEEPALPAPEASSAPLDEFTLPPDWHVTEEQHLETQQCGESKLGVPPVDEPDENRAWRAFVICVLELGFEDLYWSEETEEFIEFQRTVTLEGMPSFWEQVLPFL